MAYIAVQQNTYFADEGYKKVTKKSEKPWYIGKVLFLDEKLEGVEGAENRGCRDSTYTKKNFHPISTPVIIS